MSVSAGRLLVPFAVASCFSPEIRDGQVPCGPDGECPSDFRCVSGLCRAHGAPLGDDAAGGDAQPGDAPHDAAGDSGAGGDTAPLANVHVTFRGTGGGSVEIGGDVCAATCTRSYVVGTVLTFTAAPDASSVFTTWGGACSGSAPCTLTLPSAGLEVSATFALATVFADLRVATVGPGTVAVSPAGTSCGAGCVTLGVGTSVTLTGAAAEGFSMIGWTGAACESVGTDPCTFTLEGDTEVVARFCAFNEVVDPAQGLDTNPGTCNLPFATLTHALASASAGDLVLARPGVYDSDGDEVFPLIVPDGVTVIGNEAEKGGGRAPVRIVGGAPVPGSPLEAGVVVGKGAVVAGLRIVNPTAEGVLLAGEGATVRNCTIEQCGVDGVYVGAADAVVLGNLIVDQSQGTGVWIAAAGQGTLLQGNTIARNAYGVEAGAGADLGGGAAGSLGGNVLSCNVQTDLIAVGGGASISVAAEDNLWDHMPPTTGCGAMVDICEQDAQVTFAGAALAPAPCP